MPRASRKERWAVGLTDAEYKLAKQNKLWKRDDSAIWWTRIEGKKTSLATEILADAVASVAKKRHDSWKEKEMGVARKYTWAEACKKREQESSRGMASWRDERQRLSWWWQHLKHVKDLNEITRDMIANIIESGKLRNPDPNGVCVRGDGVVRVDRSGPASCNTTANKYVRVVQTILNKAEREWGWKNRAPLLKRYDEGLPRDAAPTPYEVVKLVELMPQHTADMLAYGAMTLHRRANVTGLKWEYISWEKRAVWIEGSLTKTGKRIYVPLNSVALDILQRRYQATDRHREYVFAWRGEKIEQVVTGAFRKAREALHMREVCFHTMRHCGQTWLAEEGVSVEQRARLGGWTVAGMGAMDDYTHLNIEPLRPTAEILATKWRGALALRAAERGVSVAQEPYTETAERPVFVPTLRPELSR